MKYFPYKEETDIQIKSIRKAIRLAMNGVSADAMTQAGINYQQNYGLSIPKIKEIALRYEANALFAEQLWELKIRESMIIACLLYPKDSFTEETCNEWVSAIPTNELCEQASIILFQHLPYSRKLAINWVESENTIKQICGFLTLSRILSQLQEEEISLIVQNAIRLSTCSDKAIYHAISVCLRFICRLSTTYSNIVSTNINKFEKSTHIGQQYIFEEVQTEIDYSH